jgi:hypothetical protein
MAQEIGTAEDAARFTVGSVVAQSVSVFLRHPLVFASLCILLAIPDIAYDVWSNQWFDAVKANPGAYRASKWIFFGIISFTIGAGVAISIAAYTVAQAAFTIGLIEQLLGRGVTFIQCLRRCVPTLPSLLALSLFLGGASVPLVGLGILIGVYVSRYLVYGLGALVVVAIFVLSVAWWVVAPVITIEGTAALASFQRSLDLTRGYRWRIFALVLLPGLFAIAGAVVLGLVLDQSGWVYAVLDHGLDIATMIASAMFVSVGYIRLRAEQEGFSVQDDAAVFD